MASYEAGSVTAKVILDTKEFNEAIGKLKSEIKDLKTSFNSIKGSNGLDEQVKKLKEDIKTLTDTNKNYRETIKNLRKENDNLSKSTKTVSDSLKDEQKTLDTTSTKLDKVAKSAEKVSRNVSGNKPLLIPTGTSELDIMEQKLNNIITKAKEGNIETSKLLGKGRNTAIFNRSGFDKEVDVTGWQRASEVVEKTLTREQELLVQVAGRIKEYNSEANRTARAHADLEKTMAEWLIQLAKEELLVNKNNESFRNQQSYLRYITTGYNEVTGAILRTTEVLEKFNFALLDGVNKESIFYQRTVHLASAMQRLNSQGSANWQGRQVVGGYSNYLSQITSVNSALGKQTTYTKDILGYQSKFAQGNEKSVSSLRKLNGQLNSSTNALNTLRRGMQYVDKSALRARYDVDSFGKGVKVAGEYTKISAAEMKKMGNSVQKTGTNIRQAGRGLTSFNNGVVQTAHSGRILSNTLYQIRGALLSLKMIFTAMGGMMVWSFVMDMGEAIKETVTAKNEMDAMLNQNSNLDASGIQSFRKELDKLPQTFKKVNKYSVGETVASIGVEFDMTASQMKKALPIVTMIQSEYVRAGRKESEAALAVKDILQGEFQRLSRETGVGKEELIAYGWDEDKENIDGLLSALDKAGRARHWDVFAQKATSLNDVLTITKSRFSEFGADLATDVTPLIIGAFNTIIDTIDGLQKAFNGMSAFDRNAILIGGGTALFAGILTALPMVTKGMGLAEIATLGWGKSVLTAVFNLNKAEVGLYGFRKALAAVITGTKASEIANVRTSKAILGRVLGLNQATLAERGYLTALVKSKMQLTTYGPVMSDASIAAMNLRQKIIYLAKGELVADKASAGWGKTIKSLITSTKLWRLALLSVTAIGVTSWLVGVAAWADIVGKRVEKYNDILTSGKDKIAEIQQDIDNYQAKMDEIGEDDPRYAGLAKNLEISKHNLQDMEMATQYAERIKVVDDSLSKHHDNLYADTLNTMYSENGVRNVEKYGRNYQQIKATAYDIQKSEEEAQGFRYASLQHIHEHVNQMKAANIGEKERVQYITEYSVKAQEAADNLKKFNQGDMMAGVYYVLNRLQLMWIDLWNDKDFINFWKAVQQTFKDLEPTIIAIKDALVDFGRNMLKYFSTDEGRWVATIGAIALGFGAIAYKLRGVIGKLGGLGKSLWKRIKDWKKLGDTAEEANDKMDTKTTGGTTGGSWEAGGNTKWVDSLKTKLGNDAITYARAALGIAAGMVLITEAIYLLRAPMWALANTGVEFKKMEPQIKQGIEGLQLIAPTIIAFTIPIMALMKVMDMWGDKIINGKTIGYTMAGIAISMTMVTEAILVLIPPMYAMATLGNTTSKIKDSAVKGVKAMKFLGEALKYLAPFVPIFIGGIALMAAVIAAPEIGIPALVAVAGGIAVGMLAVAEAIAMMTPALTAISNLGNSFTDVSGAKKGAQAIKVVAVCLTYVEQAMSALAGITFDDLARNIAKIVAKRIDIDLKGLTGKGGIFEELQNFANDFNELEITPIDSEKAQMLATSADNIQKVSDALKTVGIATMTLANIEEEFTGVTTPIAEGSEASEFGVVSTTTTYFDNIKQIIRDLNSFVQEFNNLELTPPDEGKVEAVTQSATMIEKIKTAVDSITTLMGGIGDATWASNMAGQGLAAAISGWAFGGSQGGSGGQFISGLGTSFVQMLNVIEDVMTFNQEVSKLTGGTGENDAEGAITAATDMVTAIEGAIQNLANTLSTSVPTVQTSAKQIGEGVKAGVKEGMNNLGEDVKKIIADSLNAAKPTASTYGKGIGWNATQGYKSGLKLDDATKTELNYVYETLEGAKQTFYNKGEALGASLSEGYRSKGLAQQSPGKMARATAQEMVYISESFDEGMSTLPEQAITLGNLISDNFNPQLGVGGLSVDELGQFESGLGEVTSMATDTDVATSSAFTNMNTTVATSMTGMGTSVSGTFNTIKQNATASYAQLTNTTRVSLNNMLSQTTRNISAIRTSWKGMQTALIASAENIRTQTSQKIQDLQSNMASFWQKVQNPALLLGAGSANGTVPRNHRLVMPGTGTSTKIRAAGGTTSMGIRKRNTGANAKMPNKDIREYLECLLNGGVCAAGGWNYNWSPDIQRALLQWHTNFGKIYDDVLTVGKFENDDFPVRGNATIAKRYIFDAIRQTSYEGYFDSKYGSPLAAWNAGHFNCVDGALVAIAFANAFGFPGGSVQYGTWNGIGHGFAVIPGLGVIDATAIQQRGAFTAPSAVRGYPAAGGGSARPSGDTHNYGDVNVTIHVHGDDVDVDNVNVDNHTGRKILDLLGINPATGR